MPVCKKCNNRFCNRIIIDGKHRFLGKRKYCLDCSPFGLNNRRILHTDKPIYVCNFCSKTYNYDCKKKNGSTKNSCASCMVNRRRIGKKLAILEYKGGKCQVCGYNTCPQALSFHHLNPKEKVFNISGSHTRSLEELKKEVDKCILLCMNCHTALHAGNFSLYPKVEP